MAGEWSPCRLRDLVDITHGWPFKSDLFAEDLTGRPIVVGVGNFRYSGGFRFGQTVVKEYRGTYPKQFELAPGDILLVMTCQTTGGEILGIPARVPNDGRVYLHNQRLGRVVLRGGGRVDPDYLYWLFLSQDFNRELVTSASGTKILHTAPSRIGAFQFPLPPLEEQRAIAHMLGTLDDKIELNRRMSETLEAMARALFQSWFVDFDPVRAKMEGRDPALPKHLADLFPARLVDSELGEIPEGWKVETLAEHYDAVKGVSYKGSGLGDKGMPLHNLNSIYEGGDYKYEGIKYYSGEYAARHIVLPGDVIVANTEQGHDRLLIGYAALVPALFGAKGIASHHIFRLTPRREGRLTAAYLCWLLNSPQMHDVVSGYANGTTVNMLPLDGVQKPAITVPPKDLVVAFDSVAMGAARRREEMVSGSRALAALRDALLPKLISGELRVKDVGRFLEKSAAV